MKPNSRAKPSPDAVTALAAARCSAYRPLAHKYGITLVFGLLMASGAMCPKCGFGTRATSKKWARCKKCGERVERVKMEDIKIQSAPPGMPNSELCHADKLKNNMSKSNNQACQWKHDDFEGGWDTACGEKFVFTCDGPKEHGFKFCYHCGKPITLAGDRQPATPEPQGVKALVSARCCAALTKALKAALPIIVADKEWHEMAVNDAGRNAYRRGKRVEAQIRAALSQQHNDGAEARPPVQPQTEKGKYGK